MVSNFTGQSNLTAEIREKGGLLSTRNASLMEFHSVSKINKLGSMEITMWALGFLCLDEAPSCVKFTPVVLQAIPGSSPSKLGFFSLWEEQDGGILANSVASKVLTIENWSMSKESLSGMNLRSLDAKLDLCKGLELHPAHDRSNQELLGGLDLQSFDVKTAPEAAGFRLNERVTNITRPNRRLCLLGIDDNTTGSSLDSSLSFDLRTTTTLVEILGSFMSQVKNSYIQAQSSALDLEHPGTDFWVAAVALPGAFIAVVAAAQPFINFQLTFFRNLVRSQGWKTAVLCVSNSVLALGSYSAIITVTPSEIQRQERLRTWGLLADQCPKCLRRGYRIWCFSDVVCNFTLLFRGRDGLVQKLAEMIDENFTTFASSGISGEQALLITLEGLAGVGKTRFLLETKERVGEALKGRASALQELHRVGATAAVYITFSSSAVGHSSPHLLHPAFVAICKERGDYRSGRVFLRVSVVSQILFGKPWSDLPSALQNEILAGDDCVSVQKVSAHVRKVLAVAENQMVALYLLVDELQQLGREVGGAGCDGEAFLNGMLSWLVTVMTSLVGNSIAKDCNIAFITLLAGTVLRVGGKYGLTDWLKVNVTLPPLDLKSAVELKPYVDRVMQGNLDNVKRMIQLCLTGVVMPRPPVGQMTREEEACFRGYVYSEEVEGGGVVYKSPMLLVHALGLRLGIPERVVALRPQPAVGDVLKDGFFDMLHARLWVLEGRTLSLGEIFPGAVGKQRLVDTRVVVAALGDGVVEEKYQFYNPQMERFYSPGDKQMAGADSRPYVHPTEAQPTGAGFVFKCKKGTAFTDGRVFLIGVDGKVYEFWFQLKGQEGRVSGDEVAKWARAANSPAKYVEGRKKSSLTAEIREKGGLLSTRNASLMEFHSVSKINKLGSMEITMWALGFLCLDEAPSCVKFTPVVLQAIPGSSPSKLGFFSLWEEQDGGILANSVASKVLTLENWSMSKESLSGMNLRSLDAKLDLCKGLDFLQRMTGATRNY
ncbi:hypothetical protein SELMODRAFT_432558 [Selaginella moellendorffii]|uniref:Uncharacterized protein n=1 Tax=Selaginella moellendorffii TaxID=88036 RepID=D8TGD4_SELML|nr:hypothetical protein SELMODRAFT_432558 [Selaginella moellendorffii]